MSRRGWVFINYPVVTSAGGDNSGGHSHLVGNIQCYRQLGFRVICLCRLASLPVATLAGAWCLNIVPGAAVPANVAHVDAGQAATVPPPGPSLLARLRRFGLDIVTACLLALLRPTVLHERGNLRYMLRPRRAGRAVRLVELNDQYVPDTRCDGYLTVVDRADLQRPQLALPWPVPAIGAFSIERFLDRCRRISRGDAPVRILLFGGGGMGSIAGVRSFLSTHPWLANRAWRLEIFGATADGDTGPQIHCHGWSDERSIEADSFDVGLIYYSPDTYTDERLALGAPTKLWKYIDWSLPVITNRSLIEDRYLGGAVESLHDEAVARRFGKHLQTVRGGASVGFYASELIRFLDRLRMPA